MSDTKVAIIIPTMNGLEQLKMTVDSLFANTKYPNWRLIFVDGGSIDGTREYIIELVKKYNSFEPISSISYKMFPYTENTFLDMNSKINFIFEKKKEGTTKAYNKGIRSTQEDEDIFLTQNDVIFPKLINKDGSEVEDDCWLTEFVKMSKEPLCGLVTTRNLLGYSGPNYYDDCPYVGTFCMYIPRHTINMIGILDESYSPGPGDDIDYTYRIMRMGLLIILAPFSMSHHRDTFHEYDQEDIKTRNARYFRDKWWLDIVKDVDILDIKTRKINAKS